MFTLVKILYIKGALSFLPSIVKLLDPCCVNRDLHTTNIRNENAYYICISKMIQREDFSTVKPHSPYIYMIGDSHCVTPAWRPLTVKVYSNE